jgi:uncharacterized membrane protein YsdA (DUF1294 family)
MSYHILHQFDEQWFADSGQNKDSRSGGLFGAIDTGQPSHHKACQRRQWLVVAAALLVAACALYFALDARRHADSLQRRLSEFESTIKK